jgi:hypothetical protein
MERHRTVAMKKIAAPVTVNVDGFLYSYIKKAKDVPILSYYRITY